MSVRVTAQHHDKRKVFWDINCKIDEWFIFLTQGEKTEKGVNFLLER